METRLTQQGSNWVLTIDPAVVAELCLGQSTPLDVSVEGDALVVRPGREQHRDERMLRIHAEIMEGYAGAFRRLAE